MSTNKNNKIRLQYDLYEANANKVYIVFTLSLQQDTLDFVRMMIGLKKIHSLKKGLAKN